MVTSLSDLISPADRLYHKALVTDRFGEEHWREVVSRATDVSVYTAHECEVMWDDLLAYYLARATMADPNEALISCLGPDFMQHIWLLYTKEVREFFLSVAGVFLDHDPASESALVNTAAATQKTTSRFVSHRIAYHPALWQDHVVFPHGAWVMPSGVIAVERAPVLSGVR